MNSPPDFSSSDGIEKLAHLYSSAQVGQCVSSVTHDVNNFLGAVMAYSELICLDDHINAESKRMLREIASGVRRCSDLVNNLTSIARKERLDVVMTPMASLVTQALDLRRYDVRTARIKMEVEFDGDMPNGTFDRVKFERAIIYVLTNAIEATVGETQRIIRICGKKNGAHQELTIWNSGPVVPTDIRNRIFEPFFTTKGNDHIGLGLYLAHLTFHDHGGSITYCPERGFIVSIPFRTRS